MLKANKIIDPTRVRALMAAMQPSEPAQATGIIVKHNKSKAEYACEMIIKTKCSIPSAASSWNVSSKKIIDFAKKNGLGIVHKPWELDAKAKAIVESGAHTQCIPRGLKQRIAYELALKVGVSEACRRLKVCRRGIYYYCDRYQLPTPERSERRTR